MRCGERFLPPLPLAGEGRGGGGGGGGGLYPRVKCRCDKKDRPQGSGLLQFKSTSVDQRFLFAAAAALFTASFVASLASPTALWPLPLTSWITPSPCSLSEPTASPTPCLA